MEHYGTSHLIWALMTHTKICLEMVFVISGLLHGVSLGKGAIWDRLAPSLAGKLLVDGGLALAGGESSSESELSTSHSGFCLMNQVEWPDGSAGSLTAREEDSGAGTWHCARMSWDCNSI